MKIENSILKPTIKKTKSVLKNIRLNIEKKIGIKAKKKFVKKQPGDLTLTKSLVEREKRIFGHKTTTKLNYGIDELIKWYNNYYN